MRRSLYNTVLSRVAVSFSNRTNGTVNGTTIDRTDPTGGADNTTVAMFVIASGTITDGSHAVAIQESDDGSSWAAVPSEYVQGSLPTIGSTDDDKVFEVGYVGGKRYIRAVVTTTGATTGGTFGAVVLLSGGRRTTPNR